jgi:hypothetical protein
VKQGVVDVLLVTIVVAISVSFLLLASDGFGEKICGSGVVTEVLYNPPTRGQIGGKVWFNKPASYTLVATTPDGKGAWDCDEDTGRTFRVNQTIRVTYRKGWLTGKPYIHLITE